MAAEKKDLDGSIRDWNVYIQKNISFPQIVNVK